jgi:hypothetical protein
MIKKLKEVNIIPAGRKDDSGVFGPAKELWEKTFKGVKDPKASYTVCEVSVIPADSSPELAGEFISVTFWPYEDTKTKKITTAISKAKYWIDNNNGKDILLDIEEREYEKKDGTKGKGYLGKVLTKAKAEVAGQFIK